MRTQALDYTSGIALGTLIAIAGCTIEVNINTKAEEDIVTPPAAEAPEAPVTPAPSVEATPPPWLIPPPPAPVDRPSAPPVRDALLRYRESAAPLPPPTSEDLSAAPTFTPFTTAPTILNRSEVVAALASEYPPLLREAGVGGRAIVWFFIEEDGRVGAVRLRESSGHEALDRAALRVAEAYRFSPALNRDQRVPVWVQFPITFQAR
jgi:protein TonB